MVLDILENNMKTTAIILATLISTNALALRCGNELILEGDSASKVIQACGDEVDNDYQVKNTDADVRDIDVVEGNMHTEVHIVDGKVKSVEWK